MPEKVFTLGIESELVWTRKQCGLGGNVGKKPPTVGTSTEAFTCYRQLGDLGRNLDFTTLLRLQSVVH